MAIEENHPRRSQRTLYAQRLCRETGITEQQAVDLIAMLGPDWASLVREAKHIMKSK